MTPPRNTTPHDPDIDRLARRQTLRRIVWKFLIVFVALLAYSGLRWIENEKRSYDEDRGRPVVIVEDNDLKSAALPRDATLLKVSAVSEVFAPEKLAGAGLDEKAVTKVRETVPKITYQSLKGPREIVERLDEEIFAAAEDEKKALLATEDAETKARAGALPGLNQERLSVVGRLKEMYKSQGRIPQETRVDDKDEGFNKWLNEAAKDKGRVSEKELAAWRPMLAEPAGNLGDGTAAGARGGRPRRAPAGLTAENLVRWLAEINQRLKDNGRVEYINGEIKQIDDSARAQVRAVYTILRPKLPELIRAGVNPPRADGSALADYFSPRYLLDEGSGTHVVYQTLRLVCIVVLVFAVLFVALLLLRPMPFFANATDALKGQAGGLLGGADGGGVAPQVARTLVMGVAALGVGAAVAVAGSNAVGGGGGRGGGGGGGDAPPGQAEDGQPGARGPRGPRGGSGRDGLTGESGVVEHRVTLTEPIVSPSPVSVYVTSTPFRFDYRRLGALESDIGGLRNATSVTLPGLITQSDTSLRRDMTTLQNNVGGQLSILNTTVGQIDGRLKAAESGVQDYMSWKTTVASDLAEAIANLQTRLDTTNAAVIDLRDNSFERTQNSGGRSLGTRVLQVFRRDRYLVTSQSLKALTSLMVKSAPTACAAEGAPAGQRCCGGAPTSLQFSCDSPGVEALLVKLSALRGSPPMSESELIGALKGGRVSDDDLRPWKQVILKYTRMAY
ncbi:MAG TPA: hypothetical protein VF736_20885 [Pyrinomonadaceae bacterium]|jgi:hypothetical protein